MKQVWVAMIVYAILLTGDFAIIRAVDSKTQAPVAETPTVKTTTHSVILNWTLPPVYSGFLIYRSGSGNVGTYGQIAKLPGAVTSYIDTKVYSGKTYYYKAKTYCTTCNPQNSVFSNVVNATVP